MVTRRVKGAGKERRNVGVGGGLVVKVSIMGIGLWSALVRGIELTEKM